MKVPDVVSQEGPGPMRFRRAGRSGLQLPMVSLGLWQNFGSGRAEVGADIVRRAVERGVTHLDLANNYGPPPGAAEALVGRLLRGELNRHRDELVIATKAGYPMWTGPYGTGGSRKHLLASLDQSLERLGLDYVDVFYSHRFDPEVPLEETMGALDHAVRSGRALYVGISSYGSAATRRAVELLNDLGTPCVVHQASYSMLNRWIEDELLEVLDEAGVGCVGFSPLGQGLLTDRYLGGIPADSRGAQPGPMKPEFLVEGNLERARALAEIAQQMGCSLAQLAIRWALRHGRLTSVVVGASTVAQLDELLDAVVFDDLSHDQLAEIDRFAVDSGIDLWETSRRQSQTAFGP
jgi:L-glyceraldehyde 3-phosphate reductase